jgi:hypothetical protein
MYEQVQKLNEQAYRMETNYWLNDDLFSIHWWILVIINFTFLFLFIIFIDRQRVSIIMNAFLLSFIIVGLANELGNYFGWFSYPHQFISALKTANAVDFLAVPVIMALVYQTITKWKTFLIALTILHAILAFAVLPMFVYFDFYKLHNWNTFFSFLTLFLISCLVKIFTDLIKKSTHF